jgi:hypothetical protein
MVTITYPKKGSVSNDMRASAMSLPPRYLSPPWHRIFDRDVPRKQYRNQSAN